MLFLASKLDIKSKISIVFSIFFKNPRKYGKSEPPYGNSLFSYPIVSIECYGCDLLFVGKTKVLGKVLFEKYKNPCPGFRVSNPIHSPSRYSA